MASLDGTLTITNSEYRPCVVDEKRAMFHRWEQRADVVDASPLRGGHPGGQYWITLGIVEYEDGSMDEISPEKSDFLIAKVYLPNTNLKIQTENNR